MKTAETVEKIKVKLGAAHTHEGKLCKAGDEIEVYPDQAEWLAERGVINKEPTAGS